MLSRFRLSLAAATPVLAADRGPQDPSHDDVSYADAPNAASWQATIPAARQDASRMQPPEAKPGTESQSGTTNSAIDYDFGLMRPAESKS
jgi:hypothetical protein